MNGPAPARQPGPLAGLTVLELGDGVAGAAAADILAVLGAEVTTVTSGDSVLRALDPQVGGVSVLSAVLDSRKHVAGAAAGIDLTERIGAADVVICDRLHRAAADLPASSADYLNFVTSHNRSAWVTVSAFGASGPMADRFGSDLTVAAASGVLSSVTDSKTGQPVRLPGVQALLTAGAATALAAVHALSERAATGEPQHADVSAQAASFTAGPVLQTVKPLLNAQGLGGSVRFGAPYGLFECRDGAICIMAMEQHQWVGLTKVLGSPAWTAAFDRRDDRVERADECNVLLADVVRTWDMFDLETQLQAAGVPAGALRTPEDLLASPQIASRGALREIDVNGRPVHVIAAPYHLSAAAGTPGDRAPAAGTIRGLRVLEAGHILAVPLAGALLGACGAEVVKLEEPHRLDSYRTRGPYVDDHADKDYSAYFALVNHSKLSLDVDLSRPGVVTALLGQADVLMENYGPSRAGRYGIDSARASADHPGLLAISSSGYGHSGPWAHYRAYAYNLHTSSGLQDLTRGSAGQPVHVEMAWADLMTGFALATLIAAWAVGSDRTTGAKADIAMSELVGARLSEFVAAADLGLDSGFRPGSVRSAPYAPHGVYRSADGRWVAISVFTDAEWAALTEQLGNPGPLGRPEWLTAAGRAAGQTQIDAELGAVVSQHKADDLAARISQAVPAAVAYPPDELVVDDRRLDPVYLAEVDHPLWGKRRILGLAWTFTGRGPVSLAAAPPLGNARTAASSWARELADAVPGLEPSTSA
jgi:crotonobetainyl-CoA:carnitine CoA-transferase CaiB-like acyl-CoA transferase